MAYTVTHVGDENTTDYRCLIKKDGEVVSPLHDIPLWVDEKAGICNMIVEIPRGTNAKMEIGLEEEGNSIKQDTKKGKLRFVDDVFPYSGYIWNYGAFPQTWENPNHTHPETQAKGDNDPLDVCDIGQETGYRGQVKQVKVLGTLALIDEGETDWKVIVIDVNDPRAKDFNDITDVENAMPGFTMATYEWFRTYKMPAGKPPNEFAFDGEAKNRAYAMDVVAENYDFWKQLLAGTAENNGVNLANRVVDGEHKKEKYTVDESAAHVVSTRESAPYKAPEHVVARQVAAAQRQHYFSVGTVSDVLALISDAVQEEIPAAVLCSSSFVSSVVQDGQASEAKDAVWTVALSGNTFGLYQKSSPHASFFTGAGEVKAAGFDLVAAGFFGDGAFTYNAGYGNVTFKDGKLAAEAATAPAKKGDDLLGEVAPLAFIAAYK